MSEKKNIFLSSIGKKVIMSLSGIFLILFLKGHLVGNFLLFLDDQGEAFNKYAYFMTSNPIVKILSYITYISIIVHIIYSIILTLYNKKARKQKYAVVKSHKNSRWASRNMGILGSIVLIFIIIHLRSFWYEMHFGSLPKINYDGVQYKDLYLIVVEAFRQGWYVLFYVVSMLFLAFHLSHGISSAFTTLGLSNKKYINIVEFCAKIFSWVVPLLFASMPVYLYFQNF